ncbi:MAG: restriction endonuclease subunit S [Chitinivibrionales bacterium]|nr:restriction endonuclease subunit S [Chitinivibrionales bacterium]
MGKIGNGKLPVGWEIKKLGEVCDVLDSKRKPISKKDRTSGEYPYYGATGILDYVHDFIFNEKLILIGEDGAKWDAGESSAFTAEGKYWVNNHAHVIRPNRSIVLDNWIVYFLNFSNLLKYVTGLTVPKLNQEKMRGIALPLPPLPEQKRIVAILDKAFSAISRAKEIVEKNLVNAKKVFESYLQSVFANPGDDWREIILSDICEVKDGTHDSPQYVKSGIPFVTQKNIRTEGFSFGNTKFITENDHEKFYKRSNVAYGDILISMIGANRGMACIVNIDKIFSIKNVCLVKKNDKIIQYYLLYYLMSRKAKQYVESFSKGGAQEFIGLTELRQFPIIYAPKSEQTTIVSTLDALSSQTKKLESIYQRKLYNLEELKKSLLQKAFSGELTETSTRTAIAS